MTFVVQSSERRVLYTQVAIDLVDDFTGAPPLGRISVTLEVDRGGTWHMVPRKPVFTATSTAAFPGLGLTSHPADKLPQQYRVRVTSSRYRPLYGGSLALDAVVFTVHPYDHQHPPATLLAAPLPVFLLPGTDYSFSSGVPVLHGRIEDPGGLPVDNALVKEGGRERVLTDARGEFSLPLRWVPLGTTVTIDAEDRSGRLGNLALNVPGDLVAGQVITVS